MDVGYVVFIVLLLVVTASFCLGWYLLFQFAASMRAKRSIAHWARAWVAGCVVTALSWFLIYQKIVMRQPGGGFVIGVFLLLGGAVCWTFAAWRCQGARAHTIGSAAFDEPRDDVWPPPPRSGPRNE
ncbi:MAG: hypothetical protein ABIY70_18480 [Capsulimonas sp.]|uniref:hypothetical protein n=1 Tax=Capsulimonas sp. TaxID=2494211 RepID=UPI003266BEE8